MDSLVLKDCLNEAYVVDPFWSNSAMSAKYSDMFKDGKVANGLAPAPYRWIKKSRKMKGGKDDTRTTKNSCE